MLSVLYTCTSSQGGVRKCLCSDSRTAMSIRHCLSVGKPPSIHGFHLEGLVVVLESTPPESSVPSIRPSPLVVPPRRVIHPLRVLLHQVVEVGLEIEVGGHGVDDDCVGVSMRAGRTMCAVLRGWSPSRRFRDRTAPRESTYLRWSWPRAQQGRSSSSTRPWPDLSTSACARTPSARRRPFGWR